MLTATACRLRCARSPALQARRFNPGEWAKAMSILAGGGEVNYEGAAGNQDFDENGDVSGLIVEVNIKDGKLVEIGPIM